MHLDRKYLNWCTPFVYMCKPVVVMTDVVMIVYKDGMNSHSAGLTVPGKGML